MLSETVPSLLAGAEPSRAGIWLGRIMSRWYRLRGLDRYDDYRIERVGELRILVTPGVANPKILRTGAFLARSIERRAPQRDMDVLDLGTGSGVGGLTAARFAGRIVATDINPAAVRCARINASLNGMEDRIDVRQGDLFEPVQGEQFDLVLFNPPFLQGLPQNNREAAWFAGDLAPRFAAQLALHLKRDGAALLVLSTFGNACASFEAELRKQGFQLRSCEQKRYINETLMLVQVQHAGDSQ